MFQPAPPLWLSRSLSMLQKTYPNDVFEVTMRYEANPTSTNLPQVLTPLERARSGTGHTYRPWIICRDCPGKKYTPGPVTGTANFEVHLKTNSHRAKVEKRLLEKTVQLSSARGTESNGSGTQSQRTTSSYWSVAEQADFYKLIRHFGTNWQAIAAIMKTKTHIMVCEAVPSSQVMCTNG